MHIVHLVEALYEKAQAHFIHQDFPETIRILNQTLEILQDASHPMLGSIYFLLAQSCFATTQYREAHKHCDKAAALFRQTDFITAAAQCAELAGQICCEQGQYREAIQEYLTGLRLFPQNRLLTEAAPYQARLHTALGRAAAEIHLTELEHHHFLQSLFIARRLRHSLLNAQSLLGLGICYFQRRRFEMARRILIKAIQSFSRIDETRGIALALHTLGQIYTHTIEYRRAVNAFKYAYSRFQLANDQLYQASSLVYLGRIFVRIDPDTAEKLCRNVTDLLITQTSIHSKRMAEIILGRYSFLMALYYDQTHQPDLAKSQLKEATDIFIHHHCEAEYQEACELYQTLQTTEQTHRPHKNNILAFKLGITS